MQLLVAAKWVGNSGTHQGAPEEIERNDVLEMLEFVGVTLDALYTPDRSAMVARAQRIVAARGLVQ